MARNWKSAAFLTTNYVEHQVNGKVERFWPISLGMAFRLKCLAEPLANAVAVFFRSASTQDVGKKETISPTADGTAAVQTSTEPISISLAQFRAAQFSEAVSNLFKATSSEDTQKVLAEIVMDSMQDYFGDDKPTVEEFLKTIPLTSFPDLLVGVVKANKGVFGPLAQRLDQTFKGLKETVLSSLSSKVTERLVNMASVVPESPEAPAPEPLPMEPQPSTTKATSETSGT